jgi:hypothetical protein
MTGAATDFRLSPIGHLKLARTVTVFPRRVIAPRLLSSPLCFVWQVPLTTLTPSYPETYTAPNNPPDEKEMSRRNPQRISRSRVHKNQKAYFPEEQTQCDVAESHQAHVATKFEILHM